MFLLGGLVVKAVTGASVFWVWMAGQQGWVERVSGFGGWFLLVLFSFIDLKEHELLAGTVSSEIHLSPCDSTKRTSVAILANFWQCCTCSIEYCTVTRWKPALSLCFCLLASCCGWSISLTFPVSLFMPAQGHSKLCFIQHLLLNLAVLGVFVRTCLVCEG